MIYDIQREVKCCILGTKQPWDSVGRNAANRCIMSITALDQANHCRTELGNLPHSHVLYRTLQSVILLT